MKFILLLVFFKVANLFTPTSFFVHFTACSLILGCFMSLQQTELKRLLAYSSIVHVAFFFMGDSTSSLQYVLTYVVGSFLVFIVLLRVQISGRELIYLQDLKYLRGTGGTNAIAMVFGLASSAGLPPFAGFYGKFGV